MKITFTIELPDPADAPLTIDDVAHDLDLIQGEIVHQLKQKCHTVIEEQSGKVWRTVSRQTFYRLSP